MTGGPPVRGTKLLAWRIPPVWKDLQTGEASAPENSKVLQNQKQLMKVTLTTLDAIFADVRQGLRETVGIDCELVVDERCSVVLNLPAETDTETIARAIDLENIEAWCDDSGRVHVGISPWFSTKEVDQTVLSPVKVIHVLLGVHASDSAEPKTFGQKIFGAVAEIMTLQKKIEK
ncbi:MAG TPA: hypothetical protein VGP58_15140 [Pyrinomonadaceae bacterium]|nr:hypothetical protein [Pyrinomonadaceae bacterium]